MLSAGVLTVLAEPLPTMHSIWPAVLLHIGVSLCSLHAEAHLAACGLVLGGHPTLPPPKQSMFLQKMSVREQKL